MPKAKLFVIVALVEMSFYLFMMHSEFMKDAPPAPAVCVIPEGANKK